MASVKLPVALLLVGISSQLENTAIAFITPPSTHYTSCTKQDHQQKNHLNNDEGFRRTGAWLDRWGKSECASTQALRRVLFLEPEERDKAFALLEGYIERESTESSGENNPSDYDRVRGLVAHMRKRLWTIPEQENAAQQLGMDDFQLAMKEYIPGLTAKPWWEPEVFPWAKSLEQASPLIQEEYRAFREGAAFESLFRMSREGGYTSSGWTHIPLVSRREPENRYAAQRDHFPKTLEILKNLGILSKAREVMVGRQSPNSGIKMHSDGSNTVLAVHLGLDVPGEDECLLWVGVDMERRPWRNNKLLCMDTSYLHWTRNNTNADRIILLLRVWHPDMTAKERTVMEYLDSLLSHAASGKALPTHPLVLAPEEGV